VLQRCPFGDVRSFPSAYSRSPSSNIGRGYAPACMDDIDTATACAPLTNHRGCCLQLKRHRSQVSTAPQHRRPPSALAPALYAERQLLLLLRKICREGQWPPPTRWSEGVDRFPANEAFFRAAFCVSKPPLRPKLVFFRSPRRRAVPASSIYGRRLSHRVAVRTHWGNCLQWKCLQPTSAF
jgi:hypothetical protein